jgi:uncharacterized membrane protein (UPF0127 family)
VVRLAVLLFALWACSNGSKRDDPPMPSQKPPTEDAVAVATPSAKVFLATPTGEVAVDVEVVSTPAKIKKGLMYRTHLPLEAGMLFLMGSEENWPFWMQNTLISLDLIFIAKDLTIAGIVENAVPRSEELRRVDKPSLYVLEVNGGWTKQKGVVAGAKVRFDGVSP